MTNSKRVESPNIKLKSSNLNNEVKKPNLLILKSSFLPLNLIRRHLTLRNVILGLLTLTFITLLKALFFGGLFGPLNYYNILTLGFFGLLFRLTIEDTVEHICGQYELNIVPNTHMMASGGGDSTGGPGRGSSESEASTVRFPYSPSPSPEPGDPTYAVGEILPTTRRRLELYLADVRSDLTEYWKDIQVWTKVRDILTYKKPTSWTTEDKKDLRGVKVGITKKNMSDVESNPINAQRAEARLTSLIKGIEAEIITENKKRTDASRALEQLDNKNRVIEENNNDSS